MGELATADGGEGVGPRPVPESFGLNRLANLCHAESKAKGWHSMTDGPPGLHRVGTMLLLTVSELAEAFEEMRNNLDPLHTYESGGGKPEGFPIELADAVIRIGDLAATLGIDLDAAVRVKLTYNRTRPHRHGGKAA